MLSIENLVGTSEKPSRKLKPPFLVILITMRFTIVSLISLIGVVTVCGASETWTLQSEATATVLVGVGRGGPQGSNAIAAASENGGGAVVEEFDQSSNKWSKTKLSGGLLLDSAVSGDATLKVVTSMLPVLIADNSNSYVQAPGVGGTIQSASIFNTNSIGVVGSLVVGKKSVNGVAVSTDRGASFSGIAVPNGYARYGSFVDANTWFVSQGIWGNDTAEVTNFAPGNVDLSLSMRLRAGKGTDKSTLKGATNANGWFAAVSKTADAGATWTEVLRSPEGSTYYFNGVSCSQNTCVVVGEGDSASGYLTIGFTSQDAGASWVQTFYSTELFSLMAASMTSPTTGWLAAGKKKGGMYGQFYTTNDGGMTWVLAQSLENCYPTDMDFSSGQGIAACVSSSGASATVALLNA